MGYFASDMVLTVAKNSREFSKKEKAKFELGHFYNLKKMLNDSQQNSPRQPCMHKVVHSSFYIDRDPEAQKFQCYPKERHWFCSRKGSFIYCTEVVIHKLIKIVLFGILNTLAGDILQKSKGQVVT